jgi:diguanylate cyclase (GGDEF)-like protein
VKPGTEHKRTRPDGLAGLALRDERRFMGRTAGGMWLLIGAVSAAGLLLPAGGVRHPGVVLGVAGVVCTYGVGCLTGLIPWDRTPMWGHAVVAGALTPVIGVALWATGGTDNPIEPLLVCPLLYVAYFFPARLAWPLVVELMAAAASPLVYSHTADGYASRTLAIVAGYGAASAVMLGLKRRLLEAEALQRRMAAEDPLTGLANRRCFDQRLAEEIAALGHPASGRRAQDREATLALLFADLDAFKAINDRHGHMEGDRVLHAVAAHATEVMRPGDVLARVGGDEFALIAPGAGAEGARRLARGLAAAVEAVSCGGSPLRVTVSWAVFPHDGDDVASLMAAADRRLYERKRSGRHRTSAVAASAV